MLARVLDAYDDVLDAFQAYERARLPRTAAIVMASRAQSAALNQNDPYHYSALKVEAGLLGEYDPGTVAI